MNYYVKEHNEPLLPPFCCGNTDTCNEMLEKLTYMNNDPLSIFELNLLFIFFENAAPAWQDASYDKNRYLAANLQEKTQ